MTKGSLSAFILPPPSPPNPPPSEEGRVSSGSSPAFIHSPPPSPTHLHHPQLEVLQAAGQPGQVQLGTLLPLLKR